MWRVGRISGHEYNCTLCKNYEVFDRDLDKYVKNFISHIKYTHVQLGLDQL